MGALHAVSLLFSHPSPFHLTTHVLRSCRTHHPVVKHASFHIPAGAYVGICGERGAGKTTLFKLLLRLYDADQGEIVIGGHPLAYYNPVWLRSQIGLSKQDPAIFYKVI